MVTSLQTARRYVLTSDACGDSCPGRGLAEGTGAGLARTCWWLGAPQGVLVLSELLLHGKRAMVTFFKTAERSKTNSLKTVVILSEQNGQ